MEGPSRERSSAGLEAVVEVWVKVVTGLDNDKISRFERAILPHLDAAYNLSRWMTRNEHDAEDIIQDAYQRAFRSFDGFRPARERKSMAAGHRSKCRIRLPNSTSALGSQIAFRMNRLDGAVETVAIHDNADR